MLAPFALRAAARGFIISAQQAVLVKVTHETLFLWRALSLGAHVRGDTGILLGVLEVKTEGEVAQCNICTGNSKDYALLRGVNGSRMNIMAH